MRFAHIALLAAAPALVVGMTACGSSQDSSKNTTSTTVAASSITAPGTTTEHPGPTHPPVPTTQTAGDVDCGPITGANGQGANVIAYASSGGVPGCTEAITVTTRYVQATRTGDAAQVDGWTCQPQPDAAVPHICFKEGFLIGLRGGAAPNPPATTPPPTTSGAALPDADCGTVTDAGGGSRSVTAVAGAAGRVGCTEAINVATKYAQQVGTSDQATIDGWSCHAVPSNPTVGSMCSKDGLFINLGK
ncbi:hypothetical protein ACWEOI_10855 [Nocardia sp. NPDC004340]